MKLTATRPKAEGKGRQSEVAEAQQEDAARLPLASGSVKPALKLEPTARAMARGEAPAGPMPILASTERASTEMPTARHDSTISAAQKELSFEPAPTPKVPHVEANPANAELRVNLRTESLGRVEIHTAIRDSHVTASVAVEDSAAKNAVVSEFARLNAVLGTHDLQLDTATVSVVGEDRQGGMAFSGGSQQQPPPQTHHGSANAVPHPREVESDDGSETGNLNVLV